MPDRDDVCDRDGCEHPYITHFGKGGPCIIQIGPGAVCGCHEFVVREATVTALPPLVGPDTSSNTRPPLPALAKQLQGHFDLDNGT